MSEPVRKGFAEAQGAIIAALAPEPLPVHQEIADRLNAELFRITTAGAVTAEQVFRISTGKEFNPSHPIHARIVRELRDIFREPKTEKSKCLESQK